MRNILKLALLLLLFSCKKDPESGSPDPLEKNNIVFWRPNPDGGIFTINVDGENEKKLLSLPNNSSVANPNWSSDSRIYFTGTLQGEPHAQLYSMKEDGSDVIRITNNLNVQYSHLRVSVRNQLLYIKTIADGSNETGLFYSAANGGNEKKLMDLKGITLSDASWYSRHGYEGIYYISDEVKNENKEKVSNIFWLDLEGNKGNHTGNTNKNKVYNRLSIQNNEDFIPATATPDINTTGYGVYLIDAGHTWVEYGEILLLGARSKEESWINCEMIFGFYVAIGKEYGSILITDTKNNLYIYNSTNNGQSVEQLTQAPSFDPMVKNF
jgi:hypothetical protein